MMIAAIQKPEAAPHASSVIVFKTNIRFKKDVKQVEDILNAGAGIRRWNIDRADIDCVLRVESTGISADEIIEMITLKGYFCEELPD